MEQTQQTSPLVNAFETEADEGSMNHQRRYDSLFFTINENGKIQNAKMTEVLLIMIV